MLHFIRDRRSGFMAIAVLASLFVLMAIQVRQGGPAESESFLLRLASPLVRGVASVTGGLSGMWQSYVDLRGAKERSASLEEQLALLRIELQKMEESRIQNDRLRALLDLKEGMGIPSVAANVIGNNSLGLSHTILVNRGSEAGVRPNMPVVSAQGVVGRVWTVGPRVSKIQLITDVNAGTAVLVQRTRVQGILLGRGTSECALEYVSTLDDVKEGDLLVTSGLDGIYAKGLPVGKVAQVGAGHGILQTISSVPRVDFRRLEEVLILLRSDIPLPEEPAPAAAPPAAPPASVPEAESHAR